MSQSTRPQRHSHGCHSPAQKRRRKEAEHVAAERAAELEQLQAPPPPTVAPASGLLQVSTFAPDAALDDGYGAADVRDELGCLDQALAAAVVRRGGPGLGWAGRVRDTHTARRALGLWDGSLDMSRDMRRARQGQRQAREAVDCKEELARITCAHIVRPLRLALTHATNSAARHLSCVLQDAVLASRRGSEIAPAEAQAHRRLEAGLLRHRLLRTLQRDAWDDPLALLGEHLRLNGAAVDTAEAQLAALLRSRVARRWHAAAEAYARLAALPQAQRAAAVASCQHSRSMQTAVQQLAEGLARSCMPAPHEVGSRGQGAPQESQAPDGAQLLRPDHRRRPQPAHRPDRSKVDEARQRLVELALQALRLGLRVPASHPLWRLVLPQAAADLPSNGGAARSQLPQQAAKVMAWQLWDVRPTGTLPEGLADEMQERARARDCWLPLWLHLPGLIFSGVECQEGRVVVAPEAAAPVGAAQGRSAG